MTDHAVHLRGAELQRLAADERARVGRVHCAGDLVAVVLARVAHAMRRARAAGWRHDDPRTRDDRDSDGPGRGRA